jgi:endonuclease/exonuclease/phosphatase family metal-dependent hydrolase
VAFRRLQAITHELASHYAELRAVKNRRALEQGALWQRIRAEVERVTSAVEQGDAELEPGAPRAGQVRAAAWNIQRGTRYGAILGALRDDPVLREADLVLLSEIDCGLGRSGNRNVARELAEALGRSYVFAPSYLTLQDDWGENRAGAANTTALAGTAILSRLPIRRAENVDMPALRDKFSSSERRLGNKRALLVEVDTHAGPLLVGACHLDSNASPRQRAQQLAALLDRMPGGAPAMVGGDFNSSTHDLSSAAASLRDFVYKLFTRGVRRSVDGYMSPAAFGERPVFDLLAARGFTVDGFNDATRPTYRYDFNDPYALQKVRRAGGPPLVALIRWMSRHWNHCIPARLDWFAGRGTRALSATVVGPRTDGQRASDHDAVVCDLDTARG